MPLPDDFFQDVGRDASPFDDNLYPEFDLYPDLTEEKVEEKASAFESIGQALWSTGAHFVSGATLGLTEFVAPTKPWAEKTTAENVGAAIGEALGFFVPMKWIGTGVRGTMALGKAGSKAIAKKSIEKSVSQIGDQALRSAASKGLKKEVFSKEGKRLLFQHELGGETLERVNRELMQNTEASLRKGLAGQADDATIKSIMDGLQEGLLEGKHINSVSSWIHDKVGPALFGSKWLAKYTGEVAQDAVVLSIQGIASNAIHSMAIEDMEFEPGSTLKHSLLLSAAFPAIRSFGSGGERRIGELWGILRAKNAKTDYSKLKDPEDLRGILSILTGGSKANLFGKTRWTAKSGRSYNRNDIHDLNFNNKEIYDDMLDLGKQLQTSIGKVDGIKLWGKAYLADTINPATITRMAVGAAVMNLDMFKDNAAMFRHLPPEELLTHLLIGGLMSRGKGGWARDPKSRSGDAKAEELNNYYQIMNLMGIDHSIVSDYVKVKNFQDLVISNHMGLIFDKTAQDIESTFKEYEKRLQPTARSSKEVNDIIEEWTLLRDTMGIMHNREYKASDYNKLSPADRTELRERLSRIVYEDKPLSEVSYNKFMQRFVEGQGDISGRIYTDFLSRLGEESYEGAGDKVLDMFVDNKGVIRHGGIAWEHESANVAELWSLLSVLESKGQAQQISGADYKTIDYEKNPQALKRLDLLTEEFRGQQKQMGLGDGVDYYFNIGDPSQNPFLKGWLDSRSIKSQSRIANMATKQGLDTMDQGDKIFSDTIIRELIDTDGFMVDPLKYRVVDKNGKESAELDLQEKIYGIASAFHEGFSRTKKSPIGKDTKDIPEDIAGQIVGAYENLNLAIRAEDLYLPEHLTYIESVAYEKFDMRGENVRVVRKLEEEGLAVVDHENGKVLLNSSQAIQKIASQPENAGLDAAKLMEAHNDIVGSLPKNIIEVTGGELRFPLESGKTSNIESLLTIRKMLPEIFEKEIRQQVEKVFNDLVVDIDEPNLLKELNVLTKSLGNMEYEAAFKSLDNLNKSLPGFEKNFDGIYNSILERQKSAMPLDLSIFELSKGSGNVYDAMQNFVKGEKIAAMKIENMLTQLVYKGSNFRAASDYNKLVDNLMSALGSTTEKVPLGELFETYIKSRSYGDLSRLMGGLNQIYAGRTTPNQLDNSHLMHSMEQFFQNYSSSPTKTKISIARKYDLLDPEGAIKPIMVERLREGRFDEIRANIPRNLMTDKVDQDLYQLSQMVRNSRDQKMVRFTERITEDGKFVVVREWVMPWDNVEYNTPANRVLDRFNAEGVELYPISKSSIVDGWHESDISYLPNIKARFESTDVKDFPESKYLNDMIKRDGSLHPNDEGMRRREMPNGKMRFVEVSLGRPLVFVENAKSLESLDLMYKSWYERTLARYENNPEQQRNFERVWDPEKVSDPELKIRAMYLSSLNDVGFSKSFTPESIELLDQSGGHYDNNMKIMKYSKLAEGGSLKSLPDADRMEFLINGLPELPGDRVSSIINLIDDLNTGRNIRTGFYADESPNSPLMVRTRQLEQVGNITDSVLRDYIKERYNDRDRFKLTMDVSSIDGAIYIDTDMKNLFLTELAEPDYVNGFKGSIAKSGEADIITLYGKGLFIHDPNIAASMETRGIRLLMGESAAKSYQGVSLSGDPVKGRIATDMALESDVLSMGDNNIMGLTLEGMNLRFGGHLSNNAPVPHPYTHYMPSDMIVNVREGWQMLETKVAEIKEFSNHLKNSANVELANAIKRQIESQGFHPEMDAPSFAEQMLQLGLGTENPVVREAIMRMWEDQALPILMKPRNPKFSYPFLVPDLKAENPVSLDLYRTGALDKSVGQVRIQLGESSIGEDAKHIPVGSINELVFSFRQNDIDYIFRYDNTPGKEKFDLYTPAQEFLKSGKYSTNIESAGVRTDLLFSEEVPRGIRDFIRQMEMDIKSGTVVNLGRPSVYGSETNSPSLESIQRYVEDIFNLSGDAGFGKHADNLNKYKFGIINHVERGPRKGPSDFIPTRIRKRTKDERAAGIGTAAGLNALDTRSNAQGDHDGDKMRMTHYVGKGGLFDIVKQSYRLASNNEEYSVLEGGVRKANIFGIGVDSKGDLMHAGSKVHDNISTLKAGILSDQRAVGKVIGMQSGIEWMSLVDLSIMSSSGDYKRLNNKLGFDIDQLIDNGDIYRRLEKGNQSAVDFISALDPAIRDKSFQYMFFGEGEASLMGKLLNFDKNSIQADVAEEVLKILKAPSSLFNQQFDETGARQANSYNIHTHYSRINKFFSNPNGVVFNRLAKRYKNDPNIVFNDKINELIPLFFQTTDKMKVLPRNVGDLTQAILKGEAYPTNNVIKFGDVNVLENIRKSNAGFVMDEVVKNSMFKSKEFDLAWQHVASERFSKMKQMGERFIDEVSLLKLLGVTPDEMLNNHETAFQIGRHKSLADNERAALLYDSLTSEESFLTNKLEYQLGFKNGNKSVINSIVDRLDSVSLAKKQIESKRINLRLRAVSMEGEKGETRVQKKYIKNLKKLGSIYNSGNRTQNIYKIVGKLYDKDGNPNWKAIQFITSIRPNQKSKPLIGKFIVLDDPIVAHRVSREPTIEGFTWHFVHNSTPMFTNQNTFRAYDGEASRIAERLNVISYEALNKFRKDKGFIGDFFGQAQREKTSMLNNFFKRTKLSSELDLLVGDKYVPEGWTQEQALIYYKAKLLLRPNVIPGHYVPGEYEMPYMVLSDKVFKDVFTWLNNNAQTEVASRLVKEYKQIKDYLSGLSNDSTFDLHPSPLYQKKYMLPDNATNVMKSVLEGVMSADVEIRMRTLGVGSYEGEVLRMKEGEYEIREIRNALSSWKEGRVDNRRTCRPF